jgi:transmembrane sensor
MLLDELGRPGEAAKAFGWARRAAPSGALAQDALAREVESWARAGNSQRAATLAELYVREYPTGARVNAVKQFGGLSK